MVDRDTTDTHGQVGKKADQASYVEALLAFREGATDDQVFNLFGINCALHN
jgi:hypothetical protein